jgi:hypothetical protein
MSQLALQRLDALARILDPLVASIALRQHQRVLVRRPGGRRAALLLQAVGEIEQRAAARVERKAGLELRTGLLVVTGRHAPLRFFEQRLSRSRVPARGLRLRRTPVGRVQRRRNVKSQQGEGTTQRSHGLSSEGSRRASCVLPEGSTKIKG